MSNKYNDVELALLSAAAANKPTVWLDSKHVRQMLNDKSWRGEAARKLREDLEHNNAGWCRVEVTKESYDNGPHLVLVDVDI